MQAKLRNAGNAVAAASLASLIAACQMAGLPSLGGAEAAIERAERQSRQGEHRASARSYEAAARSGAAWTSNSLWLSAAGEWLLAGDSAAAEAQGESTAPLSAAETREKLRIEAEVALARGDTERAVEILRGISGDDQATLATRARVQFGNLRVADAVSSLVARDKLLTNAPIARRTSA